jgi:hypothetical protein
MGPQSYMRSVVDRNVDLRHIPVFTPWRPEFNHKAFHAGFMVDKVEPKQNFV